VLSKFNNRSDRAFAELGFAVLHEPILVLSQSKPVTMSRWCGQVPFPATIGADSPRLSQWRETRARAFVPLSPSASNDVVRMLLSMRTALIRVEMRKARMISDKRRADTRRNIQFGGLVIKAQLAVSVGVC
jgi:Conjugal transfer protein TraD